MGQEIYPNAPIALTACEVRLPPRGLPISDDHVQALGRHLKDSLPVVTAPVQHQVNVEFGPAGVEAPAAAVRRLVQLTTRDRSTVVQVAPDSIVVKTGDYEGWDRFRPLLGEVLRASRDVLDPDGYVRVGLRYIDEIRIPVGGGHVDDWRSYLDNGLLAPAGLAEATDSLTARGWQSLVQLQADDQHLVVVRYGPGDGHAVDPSEPPRRRHTPPAGPYFLFDVDSFWEADSVIPEFDPDAALSLADDLHKPVRALFDLAVTEQLRDEVLRKEPT